MIPGQPSLPRLLQDAFPSGKGKQWVRRMQETTSRASGEPSAACFQV